MGRPKKIKSGVRLSVVLPKAQVERIKQVALHMSTQEGRLISISEALRMAAEAVYPIPRKQLDLF